MPKKKFIDKKKAVTFHLVHRSQKDPLQADEEAPKHVLLPVQDSATRKEEQAKYGIFFEDDYDYLQHLKDSEELNEVEPAESFQLVSDKKQPQLSLPSTVFGTDYETDVGLLNKAVPIRGPQPDWDPDIVEGLDDDFNFDDPENQLDDDFMAVANSEGPLPEEYRPQVEVCDDANDEDDYASDEADFSENDDVASLGGHSFESEETKSRFTSYSMTSSVIRRNEGLTLLDDRFERLYEQYDDTEIGALDQDEITGFVKEGDLLLEDALNQWDKKTQKIAMKDIVEKAEEADLTSEGEASETEVIEVIEAKPPEERWDCESILSTYSNLYNHPKKISEPSLKKPINLTKRLGIPDDVLPKRGPTLKQLEKEEREARKIDLVPTDRPKDETAEEKKARKQAVKQQRRERREEKKMNKQAFKVEEIRQQKELINLNKNLRGMKIV